MEWKILIKWVKIFLQVFILFLNMLSTNKLILGNRNHFSHVEALLLMDAFSYLVATFEASDAASDFIV